MAEKLPVNGPEISTSYIQNLFEEFHNNLRHEPPVSLSNYLRFTTSVILLLAFYLLVRKRIRYMYGKNINHQR